MSSRSKILSIRFPIIPEAERFDELFIADPQIYEYKKVKVVKNKKVKKTFNMDEMQLAEEKKPEEKPPQVDPKPDPSQPVPTPQQPEPGAPGSPAKPPLTRERSVEELSMSEDESPPKPKAFVPKQADTKDEKPMDVFKNMYSEFKEYIPSKNEAGSTQTTQNKPGFMQKARGFFGL